KNSVLLTKNETYIVELLMERYPRVTGREDLLEKLWDNETFVDENTLNVNITRTRKKFQELGLTDVIETIRGSGYLLKLTWEQRSEEHTSELQSRFDLVCRLLLEKKKDNVKREC